MTQLSFGLNETHHVIKLLQRALNEKLGLDLKCDGNLGKISQSAVLAYQESIGVVETNAQGACYGPKTQAHLEPFIQAKYLNEQDFVNAANALGIEVASVKAVTETEAKEFGFLPSGFPVILFERHKFYKYLTVSRGVGFADKISAMNPDICNVKPGGYLGKEAEVTRLTKALAIETNSAYMSASYGLFQIMAFNHAACGYANAVAFVEAMKESEGKQLDAFVSFILKTPRAHKALKTKDWVGFTDAYNGSNWKAVNPQYPSKMAASYAKYAK